jgi:Ca2+-binding EF-hand superfamily protein
VIHAWANSHDEGAIQRAHQILCEMQSMRKSGKRKDLIPDAISFTSIVSAIAHGSKRGKGTDNQQILDTMFNILKDDGDGGIELDRVAYNALINAQSRQTGSSEKAEMLLDYMLEQDGSSSIRPVSRRVFNINVIP